MIGKIYQRPWTFITALWHISLVIMFLNRNSSAHWEASKAVLHIFGVFYWSRTNFSVHGSSSIAIIHSSCVLRCSRTYTRDHGPFCMAFWQNFVLYQSRTYNNAQLFTSGALPHTSWVLYLLEINFNSTSSLSVAWVNIYLSTRDNYEDVTFKKLITFFYTFKPPVNIAIWTNKLIGRH